MKKYFLLILLTFVVTFQLTASQEQTKDYYERSGIPAECHDLFYQVENSKNDCTSFKNALKASTNIRATYAFKLNPHPCKNLLMFAAERNSGALGAMFEIQKERAARILRVSDETLIDIDVQDKDGNTAMHHAILSGDMDAVRLLYNEGADLGKKDRDHLNCAELVNKLYDLYSKVAQTKHTQEVSINNVVGLTCPDYRQYGDKIVAERFIPSNIVEKKKFFDSIALRLSRSIPRARTIHVAPRPLGTSAQIGNSHVYFPSTAAEFNETESIQTERDSDDDDDNNEFESSIPNDDESDDDSN